MFGKQKVSEELKKVIVEAVKSCPNTISLDELNRQEPPEPMATRILLTVKG